jgi:transcription antitermination factor NusG
LISVDGTDSGALAVAVGERPTHEAYTPVDRLVGRWWLVRTKSRMEKALATELDRLNIGFYLPLLNTRRCYGGRRSEVRLPLFPGYLFLCGDEEARYATLTTHRAAQIIEVTDQERLKRELRQIYRVTASEEPVDLYPGLQTGRRCRITQGSLQGIEGVVIRRHGHCRIYLGVEVLGQSVEVEVDPAILETID